MDFEAGEWHIPEQNSKTGKPHIVYLSKQAAELFRELKALAGSSEWVLPGRSGPQKPFAHNALNNKRVAMLLMHFGHPVPEMHSHDATGYWCRDSSCVRSVAPLRGATQLPH